MFNSDPMNSAAATKPDGRDNPSYPALIQCIESAAKEGFLQRDPESYGRILVYRENMDQSRYGISEGWFSQSILDVAGEIKTDLLFGSGEQFQAFIKALEDKDISACFNDNGNFEGFERMRSLDLEREL